MPQLSMFQANFCPHYLLCPPPQPSPPPPALLPPLARCLVRPTIVYSVPSRASGDTPSAKATVRGEIVGRGPAERDTQPILVWEHRSYINSRGKIVVFWVFWFFFLVWLLFSAVVFVHLQSVHCKIGCSN